METKDKGQVVHYYDRARRLERASDNARFISGYATSKKRGILRSLTATRSLRFLFFTTLLAVIAVLGASWLQKSRAQGEIAGSRVSAKAMWYEGAVYLTVKRAGGEKPPYPALFVRAGVSSTLAEAGFGPAESELRIRFAVDSKPGSVNAALEAPSGSGNAGERLVLVVPVD